MIYYIIKITITTTLIVLISEISKRSSFWGAILASIPLISVLALIWLYVETKDVERISALSTGIFWLVIPSLTLFISLPLLLKTGLHFYISIGCSIVLTVISYYSMNAILNYFGIKL